MEEGIRILELSDRAWELYERQEMLEKRRLLDFVFSNSSWANGKLTPRDKTLRFDRGSARFAGREGGQ